MKIKKILLGITAMAMATGMCNIAVFAEDAAGRDDGFESCPAVEYTGDVSALTWGDDLSDEDVVGEPNPDALEYYASYLDEFDDYEYQNPNTSVGNLAFYVYDPVKHGFDAEKEYPVSIWFHGGGNQTLGKMAISAGGAAAFASDEYQQAIGGMYIIVPIANQETCWNDGTCSAVKGMYDIVRSSHRTTDELFVCGTSAGGLMVNRWLEQFSYLTDAVLWMSTTLPEFDLLNQYSDQGIRMWYIVSKHDETGAYDKNNHFLDSMEEYEAVDNLELTFLEWARLGNHMIATLGPDNSIGGQHCNCVQISRNLIFDDGTPDDPNHPEGVTGWFRDTLAVIREN